MLNVPFLPRALRAPGQYDIAGNEKRLLSATFFVGRTRGVILGTLHEIDMRPRGHP
jgi:hypothetical protein